MKLTQLKNKSGFTLLEIIIVIIILGVLASLALPKLFKTVEFSKGSEALSAIATIKAAAARYALRNNNHAGMAMTNIDVADPSHAAGAGVANSHFDYTLTPDASGNGYVIVATRSTYDNSGNTGTITFTESAGGTTTRVGTTSFAGI